MSLVYRAPLIFPALNKHTATVIFAHGLGDTGDGWADIIKMIQAKGRLNEVKFILPHAPQRSITLNGGARSPGWFDLPSLNVGGSLDKDGLGDFEDEAGIMESRRHLRSLIENEVERNGIPSERIILGGFSQGGAMSIIAGLTSPTNLGGIIGLSCWLLLSHKFKALIPEANVNKETPVFLGQGDADPLVLPKWAEKTRDALRDAGFKAELRLYPGVKHSAGMEEIDDVEQFIFSRLPPMDK